MKNISHENIPRDVIYQAENNEDTAVQNVNP